MSWSKFKVFYLIPDLSLRFDFLPNPTCSSPTADGAPAAEQPFHFPQPLTMMPSEDRLCAPERGTFALGEMQYSEPQDSDTDTTTIINQILEIPELREMLSDPSFNMSLSSGFEQGPDANLSFANMDLNLNQNFSTYSQDFSHYSDLQFNMLVNESQAPQAEAQDSPSNMVQVKTEEELWGRVSRGHEAPSHTLRPL